MNDNNFFPFMVFNEEPLLDFKTPITVVVKLISIHGNFDKIHFKKAIYIVGISYKNFVLGKSH